MDAGNESTDFSLQWALKDIRLALEDSGGPAARAGHGPGAVRTALVDQGLGDRDVDAARHGLG